MMRRHIDLIAIAVILATIGICSHARNTVVVGLRSSRGVWVAPHFRGSHIALPQIPRIPFVRD